MKYLKRFNESKTLSPSENTDELIDEILKFVKSSYFITSSSIYADHFKSNKIESLNFLFYKKDIDVTITNKEEKLIIVLRKDNHVQQRLISHNKSKELFYLVLNAFMCKQLIRILMNELKLSKTDALDRIEEFDVIIDNKVDLISLRSLYDFYEIDYDSSEFISESVSHTPSDIIDELLFYVDTDEFFKHSQVYIDNERGKNEVSFMYDDRNIRISQIDLHKDYYSLEKTYVIFVNYKEIFYENTEKLKFIFNCITDLYNSDEYKSYRILVSHLSSIFEIGSNEVEERLDEFDVIKDTQIDFLSLESLYRFLNIPYDKHNEIYIKKKIKESL